MKRHLLLISILFITLIACSNSNSSAPSSNNQTAAKDARPTSVKLYSVAGKGYIMSEKVIKPEDEWKRQLTPEQYRILREKGTEAPFTGATWNNHDKGIYRCAACGNDLFSSEHKYESGTGWPSFWQPVAKENVTEKPDNSLFTRRTEIVCSRCDGHLGHVFNDGPKPTGLRYCMNAASMTFVKTP